MTAEWVAACAHVTIALATIAAVAVAYRQLSDIAKQTKIQADLAIAQAAQAASERDRERQWQTIAACWRYITDPAVVEAKRKIWKARKDGTAQKIEDTNSVRQDVYFILNMLDGIGIGVRQEVYMETIVKDHLETIIVDSVEKFIEGGYGDFVNATQKSHLAGLMYLYGRFRPDVGASHKAIR